MTAARLLHVLQPRPGVLLGIEGLHDPAGAGLDVLLCDRCGGRRKVLTFLTDPDVIGRILLHLGEPVELPEVAPARSPPGGGWLFR